MKRSIPLVCFLIFWNILSAQKNVYYPNLDKRYKGGTNKFGLVININTKFPKEAKEHGKQGKAIVGFILAKNGEIKDMKIVNNIGHGMDQEALRVFALTFGEWIPDSLNNEPADRYFEIPISFRLVNEDNTKELEKKVHKARHHHEYGNALRYLDELSNMHPYNVDYLLQRGKTHLDLNNSAEACADFNRIKFLKSHLADSYLKKCAN